MADFDESKTLEEMEFNHVPIWVRVSNLPLGMMDEETRAILGKKIGVFKEVDVGDDGLAVGRVLRIKVVIDIRKPLMRGIMIKVGSKEREKWCSFAYEFLPDFCYICGCIGHIDKHCEVRLEKGEAQQFSRNLRYIPEKKKGEGFEERRLVSGRSRGLWHGGSSGSKGSQDARGGRWASLGSASDALTWKKKEGDGEEKGEEVTSPPKAPSNVKDWDSGAKKTLLPALSDPMPDQKEAMAHGDAVHVNSPMHENSTAVGDDLGAGGRLEEKGRDNRRRYKKHQRHEVTPGEKVSVSPGKRKRVQTEVEEMDVDE
ncbi:uncharacterized protein LOC133900214 [Phragmites australis]|uniref:uncharacterized protein LOC133900214 n=1 Tax=Phragmites australis TaxID=29695 RepID=UPI002D79D2A4|nr:uncharacterized protein LOC133900214 [Phragmites australis]